MRSATFLPPLLGVALLLVPGCGRRHGEPLGEARPVPTTADRAGWPVYEQPADGFALALPPGWTALDLNPATLDRMFAQGVAANPDLKAMEAGIRKQAAAGVKFLGLEKAAGGPNVSVLKFPLRTEPSLGAAAADFVKQFDALPTVERPIRHSRVRLPAGEAERVDLVLPVHPPGGPAKRLAMTNYLVVRGRACFVLTATAGVDEAATYAPTFDRVARSFRFLGK